MVGLLGLIAYLAKPYKVFLKSDEQEEINKEVRKDIKEIKEAVNKLITDNEVAKAERVANKELNNKLFETIESLYKSNLEYYKKT